MTPEYRFWTGVGEARVEARTARADATVKSMMNGLLGYGYERLESLA